jgi:hypothetical protein
VSLGKKVQTYLEMLPDELKGMTRSEAALKNPLFRFLDRECTVLSNLLTTVHGDF